jgi:hypothetical protein
MDVVADIVSLQTAGGPAPAGGTRLPLPCRAVVGVGSPAGTADLRFAPKLAGCELTAGGSGSAELITRQAPQTLFDLQGGEVHCLFPASNSSFTLCGLASVRVDGARTAVITQCDTDPTGELAVFNGVVTVTQPGGRAIPVGTGTKLVLGGEQPPEPTGFTEADAAVFARLAAQLDVRLPPGTTTRGSTHPTTTPATSTTRPVTTSSVTTLPSIR